MIKNSLFLLFSSKFYLISALLEEQPNDDQFVGLRHKLADKH